MKKIILLFLISLFTFILSSCSKEDYDVKLKVWCSKESEPLTKKLLTQFENLYKDKKFKFEIGTVAEGDAKDQILKDQDAAADVFTFSQDHLEDLVTAGSISQIGGTYKEFVIENNTEESVDASFVNEKLYAYPMTADNGYFLYYDKSVYPNIDEVSSLESMIEKAKTVNKKVFIDMGNGFYTAAFLFSNGNTMNLEGANFNNEIGVATGVAMQNLLNNTGYSKESTSYPSGMGSTLTAGVGGIWDGSAIKDKLGENMGCTKLPTININGVDTQLSSFAGYKLVGVKTGSDYPKEANDLALFLTNENAQLLRFKELGFGPSNNIANQDEEVINNLPLQGLASQAPYAVAQKNVPAGFWKACEALTPALENPKGKTVKTILDEFITSIYQG